MSLILEVSYSLLLGWARGLQKQRGSSWMSTLLEARLPLSYTRR